MTHRIAVAGLHIECATFLPHVTNRDVFEAGTVRGPDIIEKFPGSNTVMGGFLNVIEAAGAEAVPIPDSDGGAAGLADQAAVAGNRQETVEGLTKLRGRDRRAARAPPRRNGDPGRTGP